MRKGERGLALIESGASIEDVMKTLGWAKKRTALAMMDRARISAQWYARQAAAAPQDVMDQGSLASHWFLMRHKDRIEAAGRGVQIYNCLRYEPELTVGGLIQLASKSGSWGIPNLGARGRGIVVECLVHDGLVPVSSSA